MKTNHHYNRDLREFARELRTTSVSKAERYLWKSLLSRKQTGYRFLRQRPIDHYIVDFFCPELKMIIEIDGNSHWKKGNYDKRRQQQLESLGYIFLRFNEGEVLYNLPDVTKTLQHTFHCIDVGQRSLKDFG